MNPWKSLKDLPHNMWVLFAATLINRSGTMVLPFFSLYLTQKLHMNTTDAGIVLACYGIGALFTSPVIGKLSDFIGALRVMKISLVLTGIVMLLFPLFESYTSLIIMTLVFAVVSESFRPANLAQIVEVVSPDKRKVAFALNRLAINLGMSIGPVAGGFLTMLDYSIIFYANGFTSILAGLFLVFSRWDYVPGANENASESPVRSFAFVKDARLFYFLFALLPVVMIFFQHMSTMPLFFVKDLAFSTATFGLLSLINTVMIIFIEVPLNNAMAGWKDKNCLILSSLLTGIGFGSLAFIHTLPGAAVTIVIWTFGEMIFFPSSANYTAEIAPAEKRGEYMGFYQMIFSLAFTLAPWAGTQAYEKQGPTMLWIYAFLFSLVSILLFTRFKGHKKTAENFA